jgi:hypothetical protein
MAEGLCVSLKERMGSARAEHQDVERLCAFTVGEFCNKVAQIPLMQNVEAFTQMIVAEFEKHARLRSTGPGGSVIGDEVLLDEIGAGLLESGEPVELSR